MRLDEIEVGKTCIVQEVLGEGLFRKRLLEMGLTPNTKVLVKKIAPLKDPIELYLRSYTLSIRKADANNIVVKEL